MKVAFINPPCAFPGNFSFPLGLGYMAAYLMRSGHEVKVFDPEPVGMPLETMWEKIGEFSPDLIGITSFTINFMLARSLAAEAKRRFGSLVIMGGPHVTALPRSTLQGTPELDAVVLGEGEIPMLAIASEFSARGAVDFSKIPGAAFIRNGEYISTPRPELISALDDLPYPARELLNMNAYSGGTTASMITSRGCPAQCTFCANICMGRRFRAHSPEYVIGEMSWLVEKYGVSHLHIVDDCFTVDPARMVKICDMLIEKNLGITWSVAGRVNTLQDGAVIEKMKQAGCVRVFMGIETGSQRVNDLMQKGTTLELAERACALLREHGVPYFNSFILGNEGDTLGSILDTISFAKKLKSDVGLFHMMVPYPGTPLFDKYYRDYDRPDTDWSRWSSMKRGHLYEYRQTKLSLRTIRWLLVLAHLRFYADPFQLARLMTSSAVK